MSQLQEAFTELDEIYEEDQVLEEGALKNLITDISTGVKKAIEFVKQERHKRKAEELRADADKLVKEILKDVDLDLHKWWIDRIVTQLLNGASHQSIVSDIVQLAYDSKRKGSLYQTNTNRDSIEATYANINKNNKELDKLISRAGSL